MPAIRTLVIAFGIVLMLAATAVHARAEIGDRAVSRAFLTLLAGEANDTARAAALIEAHWEPSFLPMALEVIRLTRSAEVSGALVRIMEREAGAGLGRDLDAWQRAMWNAPEARHPRYAAFKSALYSLIDPRFSAYFDTAGETLIRLDEIVWGGVRQDGIPPLRNPAMLAAEDAGLSRGRSHRVRSLRQRRRPRLSEAHPRLARDVRRHRRRRAGRRRVLHALRHRDPLSHRARRRASPARHERLPLPLEQAHVRPGHPVTVEHDAGHAGGRSACGQGHRAGARAAW